jgi:hypothetical protein
MNKVGFIQAGRKTGPLVRFLFFHLVWKHIEPLPEYRVLKWPSEGVSVGDPIELCCMIREGDLWEDVVARNCCRRLWEMRFTQSDFNANAFLVVEEEIVSRSCRNEGRGDPVRVRFQPYRIES